MNECLDPRDGERCGICPVDIALQEDALHGSPSDLDHP